MGWVRGQTGEQKKERKAKTSRGSGLAGPGRKTLAGLRGLVAPRRAAFTGWERDPIGDHRCLNMDLLGMLRVGVAQGLSATGREKRGRTGRRRGCPQGIPGLSASLNVLPGWHPKVRWLGVGRIQKQPARAGRAGPS